jgi:hypothetical protein
MVAFSFRFFVVTRGIAGVFAAVFSGKNYVWRINAPGAAAPAKPKQCFIPG